MADFYELKLGNYLIRLRPHDVPRWKLQDAGDLLPYFNSTEIILDIKVTALWKKIPSKKVDDVIEYDWILCDKENKPIENNTEYNFINTKGYGSFEISNDKKKLKTLSRKMMIQKVPNTVFINEGIAFRQLEAINLGRLPKLDRYNIIARFTCNGCSTATYFPVVGFTIFDKDKLRYAFLLALLTVATSAVVAVILRACAIPTQ